MRNRTRVENDARAYREWARRLKDEVTRCELCCTNKPRNVPADRQPFEIHHIGRGRDKAATRQELSTVLVLCWSCHDEVESGMTPCPLCCDSKGDVIGRHHRPCRLCNRARSVPVWPSAYQLALVSIRRPKDFDLPLWNRLVVARRRLVRHDVETARGLVLSRLEERR